MLTVAKMIACAADEPAFGPTPHDLDKVVGAETRAKCHQSEVQQWMHTQTATA